MASEDNACIPPGGAAALPKPRPARRSISAKKAAETLAQQAEQATETVAHTEPGYGLAAAVLLARQSLLWMADTLAGLRWFVAGLDDQGEDWDGSLLTIDQVLSVAQAHARTAAGLDSMDALLRAWYEIGALLRAIEQLVPDDEREGVFVCMVSNAGADINSLSAFWRHVEIGGTRHG